MNPHQKSNWYIGEIILRFSIKDGDSYVHVNSILISADSDNAAYEKCLRLGTSEERTFLNTDQRTVEVSFLGLRDLLYLYDGVEDGSELMYEELDGQAAREATALVKPREQLAVFRENAALLSRDTR